MRTIDFDLEKAKSGDYEIVTENGLPVRIICWDKQDGVFKLVGLVKNRDGYEFCQSYDEHGSAHEDDTAFDLRLVCPDPVSELTDFEYAVGKEIYGKQRFVLEVDGGNKDIINGAKESAAYLYELAEAEFINKQAFDRENDGMYDENKPTKMFIDEFKEYIETALWGRWQSTSLGGVSGIRYTVQGGVIYDCVGAKEIPINKVIEVLLNALNHRNEYWDSRSATILNLKNVRYDSLERRDDTDIINEHITDTKLSDEVNTRLHECGWFVCDKSIVESLLKSIVEINRNCRE